MVAFLFGLIGSLPIIDELFIMEFRSIFHEIYIHIDSFPPLIPLCRNPHPSPNDMQDDVFMRPGERGLCLQIQYPRQSKSEYMLIPYTTAGANIAG